MTFIQLVDIGSQIFVIFCFLIALGSIGFTGLIGVKYWYFRRL